MSSKRVKKSPSPDHDNKRQSTLEEGDFTAPDSKKQKTGIAIPDEVQAEHTEETETAVSVDKSRKEREEASSVLQKGIIYFFYRPRVDMEKITKLVDAQRSYMILRPLPDGAVINDDTKLDQDCHFIELPKKQFPKKGDQFMAFVAGGKVATKDIQGLLAANTYQTKTRGQRTTPTARPMGEGVYSIVSTNGSTSLSYMLTKPDEVGDVQKVFGLSDQGTFTVSTKNPESNASGNQLPGNAKFAPDLQEEFGSRAWLPLNAKHLEYDDCGLLLIGHQSDQVKDESDVLEELHKEDESRENFSQVFEDLGLSLKDYQSKPLMGEFA